MDIDTKLSKHVRKSLIPACKEALALVNDNKAMHYVKLPDGTKQAAFYVVFGLHLETFLKEMED